MPGSAPGEEPPPLAAGERERLLQPGRNCWRIERAHRFAPIVDAADYFAVLKAAILEARHTVMLISWDFDTRILLEPDDPKSGVPNKLGAFISEVVKRRPKLCAYVLKWDFSIVQSLGRGATPLFILDWITDRRIRFKLDSEHPLGACHHQKVVVIDDALAFCGGIDMTVGRWDTRGHLDDDRRRRSPWHRSLGPWHDITTAVDGAAAKALGELARERWHRATGERLEPPPPEHDPWPTRLDPMLRDIDVAIARTAPAHGGRPEIREIEALYLTGIAAARRTIYLESQYFASRRIAEALAARLREVNGPEIVIVNPESAAGWLEEEAMGSARARLIAELRKADRHDRFRIYTPVTAGGTPIYVHAKVMAVDNRLLRVGSSNLNNRSMGFDTECDIAIEAVPGTPDETRIGTAIAAVRNGLVAEHLGVTPDEVAAAHAETGSFIRAIETLRRPGRTLVPFEAELPNEAETFIAEHELLDPERPQGLWTALTRRVWRGGSALRPATR
ncbi:phospholipase D-like domain-containing protein [Rhodospirillaceae bacterium SYSU D60014]|uniref:phospholipase D-like domain-containing protein n=1 Tax=Virgifigura deserti TaxID=2268457 RepID=UPI000E66EE08